MISGDQVVDIQSAVHQDSNYIRQVLINLNQVAIRPYEVNHLLGIIQVDGVHIYLNRISPMTSGYICCNIAKIWTSCQFCLTPAKIV